MDMVKVGIAAGLIFAGYKGFVKNGTVNTALIAVGAVSLARQVPTVSNYIA